MHRRGDADRAHGDASPLADADGRVVARRRRRRPTDVPPFDRAAMDGYAVIAADTAGATADAPRALTCVGRVFTGETPDARVCAPASASRSPPARRCPPAPTPS